MEFSMMTPIRAFYAEENDRSDSWSVLANIGEVDRETSVQAAVC